MITKSRPGHVRSFLVQGALILFTALAAYGQNTEIKATRPVTVADSIQMTGLLGSNYRMGSSKVHVAEFSPDGKRLVVVNPGAATKRKVICTAGESLSPNTLVGDPTAGGGVLEVIANGGTPSAQSFGLPQGTNSKGAPFWSGTATTVSRRRITPSRSPASPRSPHRRRRCRCSATWASR